jgi:hypothetical protein
VVPLHGIGLFGRRRAAEIVAHISVGIESKSEGDEYEQKGTGWNNLRIWIPLLVVMNGPTVEKNNSIFRNEHAIISEISC